MVASHGQSADSAGVPWEGRHFDDNSFSADDGRAPLAFSAAIVAFRSGRAEQQAVVDALRDCRLLVPLVAELGESDAGAHGLRVDKSAELSIVTVAGPDGRAILPVFSSVEAMSKWNPSARPVPTAAVRVALAASDEGTGLVVVDPTSATEFVVRRPAVWAIAQSKEWMPSWQDPAIADEFAASVASEAAVLAITLAPGDPEARFAGPELVVTLALQPGLSADALRELLARLEALWNQSLLIAERVDSLRVTLAAQ